MNPLQVLNNKNLPLIGRSVLVALGVSALVGCGGTKAAGPTDDLGVSKGTAKIGAAGKVTREVWESGFSMTSDFTGKSVRAMAAKVSPDRRETLDNLQATGHDGNKATKNWGGKDFGERMRGFIKAPESGSYTFFVSGDNQTQFFLSTSQSNDVTEQAEAACDASVLDPCLEVTASTNDYTDQESFTKDATQTSKLIMLVKDSLYFFAWYHREGQGDTHSQVKWSKPSDNSPTIPVEIVPSSVLYAAEFDAAAAPAGGAGAGSR